MRAVIVGAGIMGRLLALRLYNEGWQVTLFDQSTISELTCSHAAAGLLAPISELDQADLVIFRLGIEALNLYWVSILKQLSSSIYFQRRGCLVLHHPKDSAEWQQFSSRIKNKLARGFYQYLTQEDLLQLEPELHQFKTAYYFSDEAHLDSQAVLSTLEKYLRAKNINWHTATSVSSVQPGQITVGGCIQKFDFVFDCRGLGAKSIFPQLRGLRGELIWLKAPEVNLKHPIRFLHPRYRLYLVPRPNHHYLIGASELETEDYSSISVRTTLELLTAAYSIHAGFSEARIIKTVTHCRPTLPNHLPCIKFSDQFIAVNGLYRHGYLIAPTLVEEIVRGIHSHRKDLHYPELWERYDDHNLFK